MPNVTYDASGDILAGPDEFVGDTTVVFNAGSMAFIYIGAVLVMIMGAGVGFLYAGLLRRKNALSMLWMCLVVYAVATIQWMFWGFSLAFSENVKHHFIGDLKYFGLIDVLDQPSIGNTQIPALLYFLYQSMFAAVTPVIAFGALGERGRVAPMLIVAFWWCTLVYDPVACWTWNSGGWIFQLGGLDFAGGGPVHITSGTAALAYSIFLGKRRGYGTPQLAYKPHNITHIMLGTTLLWFGWFGFNGGSELSMNLRAVQAGIVTNLAAAMGGLTWMLMDFRLERKWSVVGFCSGAIAGLVGITPASGYVGSPAALAIGFTTAVVCNLATGLKRLLPYFDDAIDSYALHGIGGWTGSFLTGLFADSRVVAFDGVSVIDGGWINHYVQIAYQMGGATAIMAWSFVITYLLCVIVNFIPGCKLRMSEEDEILGTDLAQLGEQGYDYAFIEREPEEESESTSLQQEKPQYEKAAANTAAHERGNPPVQTSVHGVDEVSQMA